MTLENAPWALDGAQVTSALARVAEHAALGGAEGIISRADLKVSPLAVPGNGVLVAAGAAAIRNRYLGSDPDQVYVVRDVGGSTLGATFMPATSTSARSHLVCLTIGDPEFSQVGHPWMLATDPPAGTETTFNYVRYFVIPNVGSGVKSFKQLGLNYPAYALARIDMPANTSTVNAAYITDLRDLARPRNSEEIFNADGASVNLLNGAGAVAGAYENWPNTAHFDVDVPEWASVAKVFGYVEGAIISKAGTGRLRIAFSDGGASYVTNIDDADTVGTDRRGYNVGGTIAIPASYRGTTRTIRMEGTPTNTASKGFLSTDAVTGSMIRVRFEEKAV